MISYVVGLPGSGKSYKAVKMIYDVLTPKYEKQSGKDKKSKQKLVKLPYEYDVVYTNINGFNHDAYSGMTYPFEFFIPEEIPENKTLDDYLITKLTKLYDTYQSGADDDTLNKVAKELHLYKAMFVIDESHNYFDKENKVLIWWLSYHRHMYQEIVLITQNLSLVKSKYKSFAEFFYKAYPSSMKLFKNTFKYGVYSESRFYKSTKVNTEKIKFQKEVFALYKSGDNQKSKNIILKFILISLSFLVLVFLGSYLFLAKSQPETLSTPEVEQTTKKNTKVTYAKKPPQQEIDYSNSEYIEITCFGDSCKYNNQIIPEIVLRKLLKISHSRILMSQSRAKLNTKKLYVLINEEFKNKFTKGSQKNAKNNFSPTDIFN